ncbi:MAG: hypothetical protein COX77_01275 [Candidatus Komeilibacteria bacterium CG_4_10_14_0_2_um_filter_37_10]|uniref:Uncharacterized protein n=1 Tax=Candidatus Komeilibacteria bacterium CG_4_10_14_0_2_um_filter_37_10 TaxID=1974470 RepID=A0A2M7VFZ6_9BACT|nr:MAG: hypothetical protein COX77_01275 [Candidatus Komeilibacteria bacterium CG_4_10_14_0_2_um_filter_37_10]PJA94060.1 MAG: hypothetical protein CO133_00780 [Candidatus Komeilibacteria bacterium CG_4_9_14_3_um_filter_37_5]
MNKIQALKILLVLGALYYLVGAAVHFFGLTLFPFYVSGLYQPYYDTVIALAAIILVLLFLSTAKDPVKNIDSLDVIIISGIIAIVFSVGIIIKIDFVQLGGPEKKVQTIFEMIGLIFYVFALIYLRPKK